jgi:D-beta-D-heptose 7-phosphate kinase/D-beta-D-heptose 1-phosphate adenosyltransferase
LDYEEADLQIESKQIIEKIKNHEKHIDLIIVSDYQKGMISKEVIDYLKSLQKYISIDTKPGKFTDFRNFSLIKPNFKEAVGIAQKLGSRTEYKNTDADVEKLGLYLRDNLKADILITRSEEGASYIGQKTYHGKIGFSEIVDVTGAGDTCLAIFSVLDYLGIEKSKALEIMNIAAGITVSHLGTYSPSIDEIRHEMIKEDTENILTKDTVQNIIDLKKKEGKKIVFTNGCFDLIHKGHITYLSQAKKLGDILIVGLNSDSSVKRLKGRNRPIIDEESRAFVLSNLKPVDFVIIFDEDDPRELIKIVKPHIHVKGGDYCDKDLIEYETVIENGGEVKIIKFISGHSTTNIEKKIKNA